MLKLASIAVLLALLTLCAWLTRPSPEKFREARLKSLENGQSSFYQNYMRQKIENELKTCEFKNHILWIDVEQRGKVVYSGLLGHWIERNIVKRF